MKRKVLILLSLFSTFSFADSDTGLFLGIQAGNGLTNISSTSSNSNFQANNDFAYRIDLGSKIDNYFGIEAGYSTPNASLQNNYLVDVLLNYYMQTNNKFDIIWGVGPYYTSDLSAVGVAGSFGLNYNFAKDVAVTFSNYLYINPSVPGDKSGSVSNYLQNNTTMLGLRFLM